MTERPASLVGSPTVAEAQAAMGIGVYCGWGWRCLKLPPRGRDHVLGYDPTHPLAPPDRGQAGGRGRLWARKRPDRSAGDERLGVAAVPPRQHPSARSRVADLDVAVPHERPGARRPPPESGRQPRHPGLIARHGRRCQAGPHTHAGLADDPPCLTATAGRATPRKQPIRRRPQGRYERQATAHRSSSTVCCSGSLRISW